MLTKSGLVCAEAEDGTAAIRAVAMQAPSEPFDVIVMDFVMYVRRGFLLLPPRVRECSLPRLGPATRACRPVMDGPTATKEIRAMGYAGKVSTYTRMGLVSGASALTSPRTPPPLSLYHRSSAAPETPWYGLPTAFNLTHDPLC